MLSGLKFVDKGEVDKLAKQERKEKERKEKKEKKDKKRKKHEKKETRDRSSGSDGSDGEEGRTKRRKPEQREEGGGSAKPPPAALTRETAGMDWMSKAPERKAVQAGDQEPVEATQKEREEEERKKKLEERQLNPFFKGGGDGLPPEGGKAGAAKKGTAPGIGDGGASWRMKALKRAQERAAEEGRALDGVVQERWGSLASLTAATTQNRSAHANAHRFAARDRRRDNEGEDGGKEAERGGERRGYLADVRSDRAEQKLSMRKPGESRTLSWRSEVGGNGKGQGGRADGGGGDLRDRLEGGGRGGTRGGGDLRDRPEGGGRGGGGEGDGHGERRARRPDGGPGGSRPGDRGDGRDRRGGGRGEGGSGAGGGRGEGGRRQRDPLGREGDASILRAAAAGLNTYSNDGNFMDAFLARHEGSKAGEGGEEGKEGANAEALGSAAGRGARGGTPPRADEKAEPAAPPASTDPPEAPRGGHPRAAGGGEGVPQPARVAPSSATAGGGSRVDDANKMKAQAMRARLMGKVKEADELEARAKEASRTITEVVQLPMVDARGRAAPGAFGREGLSTADAADRRKQGKTQRYEGGERERWFKDDDGKDLDSLVREARHGGGGDIDRHLADNIARKGSRFKGNEMDVEEEYENDGGLEMYEDRGKRGSGHQRHEREKRKQVQEHRRLSTIQERCQMCFDNPQRPRHLTVAIGVHAYLMIPTHGTLVPGHCWIVTTAHEPGTRMLDEDVWDEVRNFKKCLVRMFDREGREPVFLETVTGLDAQRGHCVVECVPVPRDAAADAPIYFRKGLEEAESEWSQHSAKRIIPTGQKGLRGSIPENFPYFHVEFGLADGYAHIIDDEAGWKRDFGRNVLIGLMDLPGEDMYRKGRKVPEGVQRRQVADLTKAFAPFDWTRAIG